VNDRDDRDDRDDRIRALLADAVSDVEPAHRLDEIRVRTATPARRPRRYGVGRVVLAAAATVALAAAAVVASRDGGDGSDPAAPTASASTPASTPASTSGPMRTVPAYYLGETPQGLRLFREFASIEASVPELEASLTALERGPQDPDYTTAWRPGSFAGASVAADVIQVDLADESLHDRPAGMSDAQAQLALQQVIYSLQGALGEGRVPVQFRLNGNPIDQVLGEPTSEPLANGPQLEVLALVSISDPAEGTAVGDRFVAKGVAASFEATVPWEVRDAAGAVVLEGFATAEGFGERLYPWETEIDVSGLEPGSYLFVAMTDDPSGGAEGLGPTADTRTILVE
jgi:hypothetical protein